MNRPIRVLISKIGLDGHDRGAKLIVRHLRDAGMDVIYTGLWQTPAATVTAAVQEDVDVVGVSLLSAAHMTVMPEVVRLCRAAGVPDMPVVVGGIIPADDGRKLLDMGLAGVFNPGTSLEQITTSIREISAKYRAIRAASADRVDLSSPVSLARAMTRIADGTARAADLIPDELAKSIAADRASSHTADSRAKSHAPPTHATDQRPAPASLPDAVREAPPDSLPRRSLRIGVTGAPGVGKSTFIGKLARALRKRNHRVAVIAVDPTSPITGGSVLGDRLRMMSPDPDPGLIIRSLSSGSRAGGIAPNTEELIAFVSRAGFDVVLVETVGAGQGDVEVRTVSDEVLVLLMPGGGDAVQFVKAGIMEIATGYVVNKADLPGADETVRQLHDSMEKHCPVWSVSALRDEGFEPLCDWIEQR